MTCGDISIHTPIELAIQVMYIIHSLFHFLKIDILCITANFEHFFDILL